MDADLRIGPYQVVGRLGGGAMGTVHLARSPGGRLVAVKVARPELSDDPRFRERFRREIAMARAVGGFWTAAVVDADPDAPRPWLATEYVPGLDLHDAIRSAGALPPDAVRGLAAGLAEALAAIHAAGLVHRDLKPSNVLLAADGPRVIDFGISKALEGSGLTHTGMVVGTPGYLSPEQIEGREVGPASDVFAFGAVVVFAASGRNPFGEGDTAALLYRAVHTRPDLRDVPHDLRELISRCLDYKVRVRPTAPELVAALGGRVESDWLPTAVRTLVDQRRTEVVAVRPPTKVLPGDHLSPRARWWLERGERLEPPGGVPDDGDRAAAHPVWPQAGAPVEGQPVSPQVGAPVDGHAVPPPAGAPHVPPQAGAAVEPKPGLLDRLRRALGPEGPPDPASAAPQPDPKPSAAGRAPESAAGASVSAPEPVSGGSVSAREAVPRSGSAAVISTAVAEPGVLGRWWAKALGRTPQPPPPPPALADRVSKLVEQARDAMAEKAGSPARTGNQAVFRTARAPRALAASVGAGGALLLTAASAEASRTGQPGIGLLVFAAALLIAFVALRRAWQAVGRQRSVEITASGLSWRRGATVSTMKWPRVARVRIVEDKNQPWLVVWPRDPSALPGKPDHHGGYRVYPIAHEKRSAARAREIAELRAALSWYGRSAYDGS